jgi:hypothetical protein
LRKKYKNNKGVGNEIAQGYQILFVLQEDGSALLALLALLALFGLHPVPKTPSLV